ncbi:N-acylsphingosine amidohydrolase [Coniochaeta hoffmannii]|uniref:ceramidase n=1 Tax=Coniochaeta hoffmannii TaxID=91930 RepID=A0AA38VS81_9PEZI|nr:N-acylsphingosine amidohydrolase [Coniochaeta hoffmannii]
MESAGLRHRNRQLDGSEQTSEPVNTEEEDGLSRDIPSFTVDLSLKPQERYAHIVPELLPHIRRAKLTDLFDDLINGVLPNLLVGSLVKKSAPFLLRRVYDEEENAELQGIAKATELPMYLLVAFNVLLDLLLGCTSGGVLVAEPDGRASKRTKRKAHIVHFRTLDWGMDPLRELVVELNYVRAPGGPVVATTVGYFGYVGVLTGVRKGLSMSLNFRPRHDDSTLWKRIDFRRHQMMVILGMRPSVSSVMRRYLLNQPQGCPPQKSKGQRHAKDGAEKAADSPTKDSPSGFDIKTILSELSGSPSTSAYLIFCTPHLVLSCEKDNHVAFVRTSANFLTTYNHDAADENDPEALEHLARTQPKVRAKTGMDEIVGFSTERKRAIDKIYKRVVKRQRRHHHHNEPDPGTTPVSLDDVFDLLHDKHRWIINDETHYAVVMDPKKGRVLWKRAFEAAPTPPESEVEDPDA